MERKFKVGEKVVPHSKHWYNSPDELAHCMLWKNAKIKKQDYLYVVGFEFGHYVLNDKYVEGYGNYYKESDLTLYKEKRITSEFDQEVIIVETKPHYLYRHYKFSNGKCEPKSEHYDQETMKIIYSGTTTIVVLSDGSKGIAKLGPVDKFDKKIGFQIACRRAHINKLKKELKQLIK